MNISFEEIDLEVRSLGTFQGLPESPIENLSFTNVTFRLPKDQQPQQQQEQQQLYEQGRQGAGGDSSGMMTRDSRSSDGPGAIYGSGTAEGRGSEGTPYGEGKGKGWDCSGCFGKLYASGSAVGLTPPLTGDCALSPQL